MKTILKIILILLAVAIPVSMYLYFSTASQTPTAAAVPAPVAGSRLNAPSNAVPSPSAAEIAALQVMPEDVVLAPGDYTVPGKNATRGLRYRNNRAKKVYVSGSWDQWSTNIPMTKVDGLWLVDLRPLNLRLGRHEFKFLPDEKWEKGDNRKLYINEEGLVERPDDIIFSATLTGARLIAIAFKRRVDGLSRLKVRLRDMQGNDYPVRSVKPLRAAA